MRLLTRVRTKDIPAGFRGKSRENKVLKLLKQERDIQCGNLEKHKFDSIWSPCKKQLLKESANTCAYCESPTTIVSYGDVEHYRPKSIYWWQAYCYDNYLASCTLCNQKYKKAKFKTQNGRLSFPVVNCNESDNDLKARSAKLTPDPLDTTKGQNITNFINDHNTERPLILNPYIDDPKNYIAWEVDHTLKSVSIVPLNAGDAFQIELIKACEEDYGINRKELLSHRYDKYLIYATARTAINSAGVPSQVKDLFTLTYQSLLKPESGYFGMMQYFENMPLEELPMP